MPRLIDLLREGARESSRGMRLEGHRSLLLGSSACAVITTAFSSSWCLLLLLLLLLDVGFLSLYFERRWESEGRRWENSCVFWVRKRIGVMKRSHENSEYRFSGRRREKLVQ